MTPLEREILWFLTKGSAGKAMLHWGLEQVAERGDIPRLTDEILTEALEEMRDRGWVASFQLYGTMIYFATKAGVMAA